MTLKKEPTRGCTPLILLFIVLVPCFAASTILVPPIHNLIMGILGPVQPGNALGSGRAEFFIILGVAFSLLASLVTVLAVMVAVRIRKELKSP
jgi:hypothetical protein